MQPATNGRADKQEKDKAQMLQSQIQRAARFACLAALAATVSAGAANADTLFTTFSGSPSFNQYEALGIGDFAGAGDVVFAMQFTPTSTADLTDAVLGLGNYSGSNTPITLDLESDASGLPGAVLATLTQQGTIPTYSSPGLITFDYSGAPLSLTQGANYWLVALETDPNSQQAWFLSNAASGFSASNYSGSATGPWTAGCPPPTNGCSDGLAAFQVDGTIASTITPVPEPVSTPVLELVLMACVAIVIRRRITIGS